MGSKETLLLIKYLRGTRESVCREASWRLAHVFPHLEIGIDASLLNHFHSINVKNEHAMAVLILPILKDKGDKLN